MGGYAAERMKGIIDPVSISTCFLISAGRNLRCLILRRKHPFFID